MRALAGTVALGVPTNAAFLTRALADPAFAQGEATTAFVAERGLDVRFLGFVNIDGLPALYAAADVFVHSPEIEQYGMVVLEAAVLGLPMVLSDRVGAIGPSSIARPDANALVYPFGDIEALARAIARLRDDQALRLKMGQASLDISADHSGAKSVAAVIAVCA